MANPPIREEVLNVLLAALLEKRGLLSLPETIRRLLGTGKRRLPDVTVTVADLFGLRVVVEGRIAESAGVKDTLLKTAQERVEEGLSPLCLAVLYPPSLRASGTGLSHVQKALERESLEVRIVSEGSQGEWAHANVDEVAALLRRSYELLVTEDVVVQSVAELRDAIESAAETFSAVPTGGARLRELMGIPEETLTPKAKD